LNKIILIAILYIIGLCGAKAQPYFSKTYKFTENNSSADQLLIVNNEIFVKYGAICDQNVECSGLSKLSKSGELIWNANLMSFDAAAFDGIFYKNDFFQLGGHTKLDTSTEIYLIEFNETGDTTLIFQKQYEGKRGLQNVLNLSDSITYLLGLNSDSQKITFQKLNNGILQIEDELEFNSRSETPIELRYFKNNLLMLSQIQIQDFKQYAFLFFLNEDFNINSYVQLRERQLGSAFSNIEVNGNFIYVTQSFFQTDDITMNRTPPILYKIDSTGNIVWELEFRTRHNKGLHDLIIAENGDIICVGTERSRDRELWDFDMGWIIRVSSDGELLWEKSVIDTRYDFHGRGSFEAVEEASNGDLIIGGWIADTTSANINNLTLNSWLVRLTSEGCFFDNCDSTQIITNVNSIDVELPEFEIYPNPSFDFLYVQPLYEKKYSLSIFNVNGELIQIDQNLRGKKRIDTSNLNKGIYFLKIYQDGATSFQKVIKL
jgi:hypothetical protein